MINGKVNEFDASIIEVLAECFKGRKVAGKEIDWSKLDSGSLYKLMDVLGVGLKEMDKRYHRKHTLAIYKLTMINGNHTSVLGTVHLIKKGKSTDYVVYVNGLE